MASIRVDSEQMLQAVNSSLEEVEWYLDLRTGELIPYSDEWLDDGEDVDPTADAVRYQPIEPLSAHEEWRIRSAFVEMLEDEKLRQRLQEALAGQGAFRRFDHVLAEDAGLEQRWRDFEQEQLLSEARAQLEADGIEVEFV